MQSQDSVIVPTFPSIFVTLLPLLNTKTSSSSPVITQTTTVATDTLRLAKSLFKSNDVHR